MFLLGVLLVALGIGASIALHEIGHLVPAKKFGVKVTQYMVGFGPTLWSRQRGETEYGIKAIPLGGYIRMIGMFPPRAQDVPGELRSSSTGRFSQMIDAAREESTEHIDTADEHRVFYKLKTYQKLAVMFGGPFMNLVIGTVLLLVIACGIGVPQQKSAVIASVQPCLVATAKTCASGQQTPAARAGVEVGDRVISIDGVEVSTTTETTGVIRAHPGDAIPLVVARDGTEKILTITPVERTLAKYDADGAPVLTMTGKPVTEQAGFLGAGIGGNFVKERQSLSGGFDTVGGALKQTASVFLKIPQKMVGVFHAAFGSGQRDVNGPVSVVGVGRVAGDVAESNGVSLMDKLTVVLSILASLNLALFVFNMVPLLPLDGGHIAGAIWEAIKRPFARARGARGPIYVDVAKALPVAYVVAIALIGMSALLMYADVVNPIKPF